MLSHFYDSPTFLGQKDKYLLGLTLVQLIMLLGVGFLIFMLSLALPFEFFKRILLVVPATGAMAVLMFTRLSGLSIPAYVYSSILGLLRQPSFEVKKESVLVGEPGWVEAHGQRSGSKMGLGRRRAVPVEGVEEEVEEEFDFEARKVELQAEVDKQVTAGAVAAEQWVREGVRTLFKGS